MLRISYVHVNRTEVEHSGMSTTIFRMLVDNVMMPLSYLFVFNCFYLNRIGILKEIDLTSFPFERKTFYSEKVDLLLPFWVVDYILMQPWPEEESRLLIPIRPFTPTVKNPFLHFYLVIKYHFDY